jgi:hypothetical protein
MSAQPPLREPYYFDNETYGWAIEDCQRNLIETLAGFVRTPLEFKGDAHGRIWHFGEYFAGRATLLFTSDRGDGRIELEPHESGWVKAELFVGDDFKFRVWVDEPYEEKDFWPDAADGIVPPNGDPQGRISKRGRWLQLQRAHFPSVPAGDGAWWSVEDTRD